MCFLNFTDLSCSMEHEEGRKAAIVAPDSVGPLQPGVKRLQHAVGAVVHSN